MNTQEALAEKEIPLEHADFHNACILSREQSLSQSWKEGLERQINKGYISALTRSMESRNLPEWAGLAYHAIPSPIIRVDGEKIMEIEARPDGIMVMDMILGASNPGTQRVFRNTIRNTLAKAGCKEFVQFGTVVDDSRFAEIAELPYRTYEPHKVTDVHLSRFSWIRADTETTYPDEFYSAVDQYSLVPNREDGNKEYLLGMQETSATLYDYNMLLGRTKLPWTSGFVLKRIHHAAHGNDVVVYKGDGRYPHLEHQLAARRKVDELLRKFDNLGELMIQEYVPPAEVDIVGKTYYAIPRTFWYWNFQNRKYEYLAGLMNGSSDSEVIHGSAPNACFWNISLD